MNEILTSPAILAAITIIGAVLIVVVLTYLVQWLMSRREVATPIEAQVHQLLLPWIYRAIASAYATSETAVDELGRRLDGVDKKRLADQMYDLLPDTIGGHDIRLIKAIVSREQFSRLVEDVYREFRIFYELYGERYHETIREWLASNPLPPPTLPLSE